MRSSRRPVCCQGQNKVTRFKVKGERFKQRNTGVRIQETEDRPVRSKKYAVCTKYGNDAVTVLTLKTL